MYLFKPSLNVNTKLTVIMTFIKYLFLNKSQSVYNLIVAHRTTDNIYKYSRTVLYKYVLTLF